MRNYKFQLPIAELPPLEFERLILWILKEDSEWENIQWRGEAGGEKGKDLMAIKKKSKRYWIFQCKRVKLFGPADFIKEFDNVFPELIEYSCEGYILILSIKASDKLLKKIEEKEKESNILIEVWSKSELDYKIKNSKVVLNEFFK